jgi:hypothetical protein
MPLSIVRQRAMILKDGTHCDSFAHYLSRLVMGQTRLAPRIQTYWSIEDAALFMIYERYLIKITPEGLHQIVNKCKDYNDACEELHYIIHEDIQTRIDNRMGNE